MAALDLPCCWLLRIATPRPRRLARPLLFERFVRPALQRFHYFVLNLVSSPAGPTESFFAHFLPVSLSFRRTVRRISFKGDHGDGAVASSARIQVNPARRRLSVHSPNPGSLTLGFHLMETFSGELGEVFDYDNLAKFCNTRTDELTFFYCGGSIRMLWTMADARVSTEASIGGVLCKD